MSDELLKQIVDKLNVIASNQNEFKEHFDKIDKKLDSIVEQVVKNSEDIMRIKTDQHVLVTGQAKQDKILEALAMRSLEQETDIKELKRVK